MNKQTALTLMCAVLVTGCTTLHCASARRLDQQIQGEWQLVQWSNRNMAPGHGELVYRIPVDPVVMIIRNGYVVTVQGTNIVSSTPYYLTTAEDLIGGGVRPILHDHPGRNCTQYSEDHQSFFLEDGRLHLLAWDVEGQHGCQNANNFEYRPATQSERTFKWREPPVGGDGKPAPQP